MLIGLLQRVCKQHQPSSADDSPPARCREQVQGALRKAAPVSSSMPFRRERKPTAGPADSAVRLAYSCSIRSRPTKAQAQREIHKLEQVMAELPAAKSCLAQLSVHTLYKSCSNLPWGRQKQGDDKHKWDW